MFRRWLRGLVVGRASYGGVNQAAGASIGHHQTSESRRPSLHLWSTPPVSLGEHDMVRSGQR